MRRVDCSASVGGWASGALLYGVVAGLTGAVRAHDLSIGPFASNAAQVAAGRLWLLLSSALVVDRPVVVGLVAFGLIGSATLWLCGARTFWVAALVGHVGSTLLVYAIIAVSRLAEPHLFSAAVASPDFGVSAMQGAWVGALTATGWLRYRHGLRQRMAMAAAVSALAGVAWLLHPDPSILTTEHLFAFLIGASIASWGRRPVALAPSLRRYGRAALAYARSAPLTFGYLLVLFATTAFLTTESGDDADRLLLGSSTNLDHLGRDPVRVLVASAFWLSSNWRPLAVAALLLIGLVAPLEHRVGSRRTAVVLAAGHVGATLLTAAGLWLAVHLDVLARSVAHARDVGPSYAVYAAAASLTYLLAPRWRLPYLAAILLYLAVPGFLSPTFSDVGHLLAIGIGLACYPVVKTDVPDPQSGRVGSRMTTAVSRGRRAA